MQQKRILRAFRFLNERKVFAEEVRLEFFQMLSLGHTCIDFHGSNKKAHP